MNKLKIIHQSTYWWNVTTGSQGFLNFSPSCQECQTPEENPSIPQKCHEVLLDDGGPGLLILDVHKNNNNNIRILQKKKVCKLLVTVSKYMVQNIEIFDSAAQWRETLWYLYSAVPQYFMIDDSDYLCKNDNTQNEVTQNNMDTDNDVHTHYAGAELLVCDVQRVSAPVEPAARPVLRRPVPGQMGNLASLRRTELLSPPPPLNYIFHSQGFIFTRVLCVA